MDRAFDAADSVVVFADLYQAEGESQLRHPDVAGVG
jgi:hypothetical protein